MRSSIVRCFVLTVLTFGLAWYAQISVAQRAYGDDTADGVSVPAKVVQFDEGREKPLQFFDV